MASVRAVIAEFIEKYHECECLWKINNPFYKNKQKRLSALEALLQILRKQDKNANMDSVTKKINNLRCAFKKEHNKIKATNRSGVGTDELYISKLWFYDLIMFLSESDNASRSSKDIDEILNEIATTDNQFQNDVDVKWRICRVLYTMSKDSKYDQSYRKDLIKQAYDIIAYELPNSGDNYAVHKWYALILDAKTSFEGYKERIKHLEKIKEHFDFAVALNPNDATTLHMLGEWCYQLSEMPWHQRKTTELLFYSLPKSSYEDALEYFLKAESVQPRFYSINLLRLGSCYLKLNKEDQAKYYLQLAASYPAKSNEDHQANKEATELLKKLK